MNYFGANKMDKNEYEMIEFYNHNDYLFKNVK